MKNSGRVSRNPSKVDGNKNPMKIIQTISTMFEIFSMKRLSQRLNSVLNCFKYEATISCDTILLSGNVLQ